MPDRRLDNPPAADDHQGGAGKDQSMNLIIWLPALFLLGLATFALMLAFVVVCERV